VARKGVREEVASDPSKLPSGLGASGVNEWPFGFAPFETPLETRGKQGKRDKRVARKSRKGWRRGGDQGQTSSVREKDGLAGTHGERRRRIAPQ